MKCRLLVTVFVLGFVNMQIALIAVSADNPYHTIVDRNPFGLNPPPTLQTNDTIAPPKNIKFNGITYVRGQKKAFFTIPGKEAKDPPQYATLGEAEHADVLEVIKIYKDEGEVEVVNSGVKMVLNFKNNGNKGQVMTPSNPVVSASVPTASVVYNPIAGLEQHSSGQQVSSQISQPVVQGGNPSTGANSPVYGGGGGPFVASRSSGRVGTASAGGQQIDVEQQRMNMLAQHAAATAAYERGETQTFYKPQTDPKVFAPGGVVPVHRAAIPPPPPPPAPGYSK